MKKLINWSQKYYQDLPWRQKRSLYTTLVSEIMLQQTTVQTVINHFERFLKVYPSIKSLAQATEEEICIEWKGLGYYRRARNLLKAAKYIHETYSGRIPKNYEKLIAIPGIGDYTANAILSIGADIKAVSIDANLERVLSRIYRLKSLRGPALHKEIKIKFNNNEILKNIEKLGARKLNEALMDLGREVCKARSTNCEICPLNMKCMSYKNEDALSFPKGLVKKTQYYSLKLLRIVIKDGDKVLSYQKDDKEWLAGQWELPTFIIESEDKKLSQYPLLPAKYKLSKGKSIKSSITKYRIENIIVMMEMKDFKKSLKLKEFKLKPYKSTENFSTITHKILNTKL